MFILESMKSFGNHVSKVYSNAHKQARNANMSAEDAAAAAVRARVQLLSKTFCVFPLGVFKPALIFPSWCLKPLCCAMFFSYALRWTLQHGPRDHPSVLKILKETGEAE